VEDLIFKEFLLVQEEQVNAGGSGGGGGSGGNNGSSFGTGGSGNTPPVSPSQGNTWRKFSWNLESTCCKQVVVEQELVGVKWKWKLEHNQAPTGFGGAGGAWIN
jgi:hypothetical protein